MANVRKRWILDSVVWTVSLLFAFGLLIDSALADSSAAPASNPVYKAECGSCHLAYPPNLLPAPAWRRVMAGLERHFGTDASADPRTAAEIGAYLDRDAGQGRKRGSDSGTLRITDTPWFRRQHDEVPASTWNNPRVKTASNCGACHAGATRGDFDEDSVRIPR